MSIPTSIPELSTALIPTEDPNVTSNVTNCMTAGPELKQIQFYFVGVFGTFLAILGLGENTLILYLFLARPYFRKPNYLYLTILAALDLIHCINYILVMGMVVIIERKSAKSLSYMWQFYAVPLTMVDYIVCVSSAYLLVSASLEKFLLWRFQKTFSKPERGFALAVVFMIAIFFNGTIFWEMKAILCPNTGLYDVGHGAIMSVDLYDVIWCYWIRTIVNTFTPFFLLTIFNIGFVLEDQGCHIMKRKETTGLSRPNKSLSVRMQTLLEQEMVVPNEQVARQTSKWMRRAKGNVKKSATRTLIAIVVEYLLSNGLAVFISSWEKIDQASLSEKHWFYFLATDVISMLTVLSTVLRLPIYWFTDNLFQVELRHLLIKLVTRKRLTPRKEVARETETFSGLVSQMVEAKRKVLDSPDYRRRSATVNIVPSGTPGLHGAVEGLQNRGSKTSSESAGKKELRNSDLEIRIKKFRQDARKSSQSGLEEKSPLGELEKNGDWV